MGPTTPPLAVSKGHNFCNVASKTPLHVCVRVCVCTCWPCWPKADKEPMVGRRLTSEECTPAYVRAFWASLSEAERAAHPEYEPGSRRLATYTPDHAIPGQLGRAITGRPGDWCIRSYAPVPRPARPAGPGMGMVYRLPVPENWVRTPRLRRGSRRRRLARGISFGPGRC